MSNESETVFNKIQETPIKTEFFALLSPGRTGSTLLTHILNQHPEIKIVSEPYLIRVERSLAPAGIEEFYTLLKYSLQEVSGDKHIGIAEKTGTNYDNLVKYVTNKIILVVRDPKDALASAKEKWFKIPNNQNRFKNADEYLKSYYELVTWTFDQKDRGCQVGVVRYEDLVQNSESTISKTLDFLGLNSSYSDDIIKKASSEQWQSRGDLKIKRNGGKIHKNSIGRWKEVLNEDETKLVFKKYKRLLTILDY